MSALEDEIMQKFRLLDKRARERVLLQMQQVTTEETAESEANGVYFDFVEWARGFRARTQSGQSPVDAADLINEIREERLDDIMGSS